MANPPNSLNLAALDTRLVNALRDSTVASATRYQYLQDAYSRIYYKYPWEFRRAEATLSVSADVSAYALDSQCDLPVAVFNATLSTGVTTNKGFDQYWNNFTDNTYSGYPEDVIDFRSVNGDAVIILGQLPSSTNGHGNVLRYYFYKHLIHNDSTGATATGNMTASTDVPSFAPQFHAIVMKDALLEVLKDRREFGEMYQATLKEYQDLLDMMEKRYLTPSRNNRQFRVIR